MVLSNSVLRTISTKRVFNVICSVVNYFLLKLKTSLRFNNHPITITLELSSVCNLACPECPVGLGIVKRENCFMGFEMAKKIIDTHYKKAMVAILYFQGEPFQNPQWYEIISYAHKKRLFTIVSTNAQTTNYKVCEKIIDCGLDRLIISADGVDQATYEKYRIGGDFSKIENTVRDLCLLKKSKKSRTPKIVYQTLLSKFTEYQTKEIKQHALLCGADKVEFKTMQIYDHSSKNLAKWLPQNSKYQRKNLRVKSYQNKSKVCWRALTNAVYTADGYLVPCCFDKLAEFSFGSIDNSPWESNKRILFLKNLSKGLVSPPICDNCTNF